MIMNMRNSKIDFVYIYLSGSSNSTREYLILKFANSFNMATGNIVFLHPLGATLPPGPSRVACANLHAQLEVARVDIHSTIMNGQTTLQGPSSIAHSSSDRDPGILLSRIIAAPFNATITALATSLDGNYLAIGDDHGRVEVRF